jgi:hypothetical protein
MRKSGSIPRAKSIVSVARKSVAFVTGKSKFKIVYGKDRKNMVILRVRAASGTSKIWQMLSGNFISKDSECQMERSRIATTGGSHGVLRESISYSGCN